MFVVMTTGASEAEVLGVKSRILAEGLTPFDHQDADHIVIAVVGEIGSRKPELLESLARLAGVERAADAVETGRQQPAEREVRIGRRVRRLQLRVGRAGAVGGKRRRHAHRCFAVVGPPRRVG